MSAVQIPALTLTLCGDGATVRSVASRWSPLPVERLLIGRDAAHARAVLTTTLVLCGHAQCAASAHALAAAQSDPSAIAVDDEPVELEAARETLRRWLIDFPAVFGGVWESDTIAQWARLDSRARLASFCERTVFGMPAAAWLMRSTSGSPDWAAGAGTLPARWLHGLLKNAARPVSVGPANVLCAARENAVDMLHARSTGEMGETGDSGSAWPSHADLWREAQTAPDLASALMTGRLRHLARICANGAPAATGGLRHGDVGIGWARCARGVLVHLARIENGRIAAYRIVPPTWWNFGRAGLLQAALCGLPWHAAQPLALRLALLLDPCAPNRIEAKRDA